MLNGIKKEDILNDDSVVKIAPEKIDKDVADIKVIADIAPSYKKTAFKLLSILIGIGVACFLVISTIVLLLNTNIVQGNIEGSIFNAAGFSIVDKNYDPAQYLVAGKTIYYDHEKGDLFSLSSAFKKARVEKVNGNHVVIDGSIKKDSININQVDYVLKEE